MGARLMAVKRASAVLLALVLALGLTEWTVWIVVSAGGHVPKGARQAMCDAAGDRYHLIAAGMTVQTPALGTATQQGVGPTARAANVAERSAALREYATACSVGAAG